ARLKRRVHFNAFMSEIHALADVWRRGGHERRAHFGRTRGDDPIAPIAARIAHEARLLCFDEFQVADIADAMILGRLFEALFARGVTVVATSNRAPDELYKDGLNRQLFLPFIALIKERMEIVAVLGDSDHRLGRLRAGGAWFSPIDPDNEAAFEALWKEQLAGEVETGAEIKVHGRKVFWPRAAGERLRAGFDALCERALGPADYLALAERFEVVFIEAIPFLPPERRSEARRLGLLIDALYEARRRIAVLAAGEPFELYRLGDQAFEFRRAASRLEEMRSLGWPPPAPERASLTPPAHALKEPAP
ncbi:MAG: cell division protein ZapE, partial [Caulobacteraceae bacterium]